MGEIVVLMTAGSDEEARKISGQLVEDGLAACVNIVPGIRSIFRWEGRVTEEQEYLLIGKTVESAFEKLVESVKAHHSYEVPEVIGLPIQGGNTDFLSWVRDVVKVR